MALQTKVGSFDLPAAGTLGNVAVTGIGFQPKALIVWTTGSDKADNTWSNGAACCLGYSAGSANSFCIATASQALVAAANTARRIVAAVLAMTDADGSNTVVQATLTSFDADGFTLNYVTNTAGYAGTHFNYLAIGGSDLTNAKVVNWASPATAIAQSVTGVGFKPDLVLHATAESSGGPPLTEAHEFLGFGMMNKAGQQGANNIASLDTANPADASRWQQTDACIADTRWQEVVRLQGHFQSMDVDGFTINFSTGGVFQMISLCLKGLSSKIGSFPKATAAAPTATIVGHVGFTPKAVLSTTTGQAAVVNPTVNATWGLSATDGVNHRSAYLTEQDGVTPTNVKVIQAADSAFLTHGGIGAIGGKATAVSFDLDGFTSKWTVNDVTQAEILYLALGDV